MLARLMRFLVTFIWIAAAFLSFQAVESQNSIAPMETSAVVTVTAWDGDGSAASLRRDVGRFALAEGVTVAQEVPDIKQRTTIRDLYLADGDPRVDGSRWLTSGMADFGNSITTRVHPVEDAGASTPIGKWLIFGDAAKGNTIQQFFQTRQATTDISYIVGPTPPYLSYLPSPVLLTTWVIMLLVTGTTGAFVVSRTRRYAIERMHGARPATLLRQEATPLLMTGALAGVLVLTFSAAFTLVRYSGAGLVPFLTVTAVLGSFFLAAVLATLGLVLTMVTSVNILGALKGKTSSTWLTMSAYTLRATAVLVAIGLSATTVALIADQVEREQAGRPLQSLGNASVVSLGNAYTEEDQDQLGKTVEKWLQGLDANGDLIVALQADNTELSPTFTGRSVLIVNNAFLANQPVTLADGDRMRQAINGKVSIIVPDQGWAQRTNLKQDLAPALDLVLEGATDMPQTMVHAAPGQTFSTLTAPNGLLGTVGNNQVSSATDPIIVAVSSPLTGGYVEGATAGEVLLTDPRSALIDIKNDALLSRFVRSVTPAIDQVNTVAAEKAAELRTTLFSSVIAYLVVITAGIAATIIYTRKNAQRIFVRHIHGWSMAATYRSILIVEAVLLLFLLGRIPWQIYQLRQELGPMNDIAPIPGGLPSLGVNDALAITVLAIVTTGGFMATLVVAHRRLIHHGVSEA